MRKQGPYRLRIAGARGGHEQRFTTSQRGVRVDTGQEETLENRRIAVFGRQVRRADSVAVADVDIGPGLEEQRHQLGLAGVHCPKQRGGAVRCRRVDLDTRLEQLAYCVGVTTTHRVHQRHVRRRQVRLRQVRRL